MVVPAAAGLVPDPVAVCTHINRLTKELKIARRLLRLSKEVYPARPVAAETVAAETSADQKPEATHAAR